MLCLPYGCHCFLRDEVQRAYPEEACGILLGYRGEIDDTVVRVIACANTDAEPRRRYTITPAELIAAQKSARQDGMEIVGFYHSHPDHRAEASEADLREAHWTGCVYLICGVEKGRLAEVAAWRLAGPEQWEAVQLNLEPPQETKAKAI